MIRHMYTIFKIWLIAIFILALIASVLVGIESTLFGVVLLPLLFVTGAIIILGYAKRKKP